jgi:phospholipase A-2-activating protein
VKFWTVNPEKESEYVVDKILTGHSDVVGALAWIPGGMDTSVLLWDLQRGEVVETMNGHKLEVTGLAVDTNGDIISSSMDG